MKLADVIGEDQAASLEALKQALPRCRLREEFDPVGLAVDRLLALLALLRVCLIHERELPQAVRDQVKQAVAAVGRAKL